jgi:C4-dicarboxylate transporter DctM subunit
MIEILLAVVPIILMLLGFPVFILLLATCAIVVIIFLDLPLPILHQTAFGAVDKMALLAVPFFIFAGEIMVRGGMSRRIIDWVLSVSGGRKGSLGLTTVGSSTLFGAISGSSPATVATIGRLMNEPLVDAGYGEKFSAGLLTSSGAIAVVVPPSISFILYGVAAEQPIDKLFLAGLCPGLLMALLMGFYTFFSIWKKDVKESSIISGRTVLQCTKDAVWAIGMPVIILGGIYLGVFSPTESAGVACVYAMLVTIFVYKELNWKDLWDSAIASAYLTAQVMIIVAASGVFAWILTIRGIPQLLASSLGASEMPAWVLLIIINLFLLVVGCMLDTASSILVLTPILVPLVKIMGVDLIHFGVIMTVNLAIGMFTPPFGLNIFVAQAIFKMPLRNIYAGLLPFIVVNIVALAFVTYIPALSLALVRILD